MMPNSSGLRAGTIVAVALFAVLAVLPVAAESFGQGYLVPIVARMIIFAIATSALNLALGFGGMLSFGHALFFGLGAYCVGLPSHFGIDNGLLHLLICIAVTALAGFLTGALSLRTSGFAFIMITLAFAQMGYFLFVSLKQFGGDDGLVIQNTSRFAGLDLGKPMVAYFAALLVLVLVTWWISKLRVAPFGMALRASQQNGRRVNALGMKASSYQLAAYVISAAITGVAGFLSANLNAFATPRIFSWHISGEMVLMLVLGGMGTVFGPVFGAIAYLGLEEILRALMQHWMMVFAPIIVLVAYVSKGGFVALLDRLDQPRREKSVAAKPLASSHAGESL
jgi:branched-chain amino acid transport system permease protein